MKLKLCMLLAIAMGWPAAALADGEILVQYQVFRVTGSLAGDTSLDEHVWAGPHPPDASLKQAVTLFNTGSLRLDNDRLDMSRNGWKWNGKELPIKIAKTTDYWPQNRIQLIQPSIMVRSGQSAQIEIGSQQQIEYFEKRDGDLYQLKRFDTPTGLKIGLHVDGKRGSPVRVSDMDFSLKLVEKREPLDGSSLPVGRPVLTECHYKLNLVLRPGCDYGILLHPGEGQGFLVIRMRADYAAPEPKPAPQKSEKE